MSSREPYDLERALAGSPEDLSALIDHLTPIVHARTTRVLLLWRGRSGSRNIREECKDLTQEIFLQLFDNDQKILRSWNPDLGLSFENFVGLVTERRVRSILGIGKRNPWTEEPTEDDQLDHSEDVVDPEEIAASRELLELVIERVKTETSELGWHLFELLFIRELEVEQVMAETDMTADAVYAWRSRLRKLANKIAREELSDPPPPSRRPSVTEGEPRP